MPNEVTINSNEFFEIGVKYKGTLMSDIIKNNILKDYEKGVKTLKVSTFINYIKNTNGITIKNFENGAILNIGDICTILNIDGTPKYVNKKGESIKWRILSRTFKYEGQPLMDLQLQEIKN